jgi:toxin ParE1/3/4
MAKYHLTNLAIEDLSGIWEYTFDTWSEKQADKYYNMLLLSCNEIAKKPKIGKQYDIVAKGILGFKSEEHIIFYSIISKNEIEVIRILHGMVDLKNKI